MDMTPCLSSDSVGHEPVVGLVVTYGDRFESCAAVCDALLANALIEHVVVLDNGTVERSARALLAYAEAAGSRVCVVRLDKNSGSAGGFSAGLTACRDNFPGRRVFVLDDDNLPAKSCLEELVKYLDMVSVDRRNTPTMVSSVRPSDPILGLARKALCASDAFPRPGTFVSVDWFSFLRRRRLAQLTGKKAGGVGSDRIPYAPYGGLLVTWSCLTLCPLPDPAFVLYVDDMDWTRRAVGKGARIFLCRSALVDDTIDNGIVHRRGRGPITMAMHVRSVRTYYMLRNKVFFDHAGATSALEQFRYRVNKVTFMLMFTWGLLRSGNRANFGFAMGAIRDGERGALGESLSLSAL